MDDRPNDDLCYWYLTGEKRAAFPEAYERAFEAYKKVYRLFPGDPRCFECDIPLAGLVFCKIKRAHPGRKLTSKTSPL
jgi:hypothetical protein